MAGTELVPFESYAIAQVELPDLLETIQSNVGDAQIGERQLDRVKMPSGGSVTWSVPTLEGDVDTKELVGVVVFSKLVRAYWQTSYDDGGGDDIPDCASNDSAQAFPPGEFVPPATEHTNGGYACQTCALAKFGSAEDGRGQACQQKRLLFMLTEKDVLPIVVALSPTSLKPAADFMLRLTRAGVPYWKVGTRVTLEKYTDPKPHARAVFTKAFDLGADEIANVKAYRDALLPAFQAFRADGDDQSPAAAA
jgi:hypothetical protein